MKPAKHIERLLGWLTNVRSEVAIMAEEGHFQSCGYKNIDTVEDDIETLAREVERTELLKGG